MNNTPELTPRDLYLHHTAGDGTHYAQLHRVWDAVRFFNARLAEADKANSEGKHGTKHNVEQITPEQYQKERQP